MLFSVYFPLLGLILNKKTNDFKCELFFCISSNDEKIDRNLCFDYWNANKVYKASIECSTKGIEPAYVSEKLNLAQIF